MVFDGVTFIPRSGWMVCLRANSKNSFGAYTGQQLIGILFQQGQIDLTISGPEYRWQVEDHCKAAVYQAFQFNGQDQS